MGRRSFGHPGFLAEVNDETVIVVQLEDPEALANAEAIAAVAHIDVAMVAQNDYLTAARTAGTDSEGHE